MSDLTRRRLLQLTAASGALGAIGVPALPARAAAHTPVSLSATRRTLEVNGKAASVLALTRPDGRWGMDGRNGERFRARLTNELDIETLIHWHGLTPPSEQDGVPGLSQPALAPGLSYDYDFVHNRAGTFWMHSHVGLQEQQLLAAPLIVRDPSEAHLDEQEVVVLLHDFTFRDPMEILHELSRGGGMQMDMSQGDGMQMDMSQGDGMQMDMGEEAGHGETEAEGGMGGGTGMESGEMDGGGDHGAETDGGAMVHVNDVDFDAYLANDRTLDDPEVVRVEPGGRVRLRIINAAAATNFRLDLGEIEGELIAVDGNPVRPIRGRHFALAIAQRADIRLALPAGQGAYPVLAQREDDVQRSGIVLATRSAQVDRVPGHAAHKAAKLDLGLERRLAAVEGLAARPADRSHLLRLTGSHAGYDWGLNGMAFDPARPLVVKDGERVEVTLRNETAMPHPIHLHGHHFQVVAIGHDRFAGALRDTVLVPPKVAVTIAFDADNPGHWAFHCHQLYHMAAGMMTSVKYEGYRLPGG